MPAILLANEFNSERLSFLPPKTNKLGGQSVLLSYTPEDTNNPGPVVMQTCRVRIPFGIDQSKPMEGGVVKYHISISLANEETQNDQLKVLTSNVRAIDEITKNYSMTNTNWFGKALSEEVAGEFYKSAEKFAKDPKWPSTLKVKLPFDRKGNPDFMLFDENKNPINILDENGDVDLGSIPKGSEAILLIQPTGVWFVGKTQFGVGYKLVQAKVFKNSKIKNYAIVDDDELEMVEEDADDVE
tara:strand:- start:1402 stop:2127 length:726 start_codon:yes stop_codon:yes gene_type:complete